MGDITNRDTNFEKNEKIGKSLKESFAKMQAKRIALFESAPAINNRDNTMAGFKNQKMIKSGKAIDVVKKNGHVKDQPKTFTDDYTKTIEPLKEEDAPKEEDPSVTPPVDGAAPTDDTTPPAPVDANAPEANADGSTPTNSQDQLTTREFVKEFLKSLPSDQDMDSLVDENGIFKTSVSDQHEGQFTIIAFPSTKKVHEVADIVEPVQPEGEAGAEGSELPPEGSEMPPVDAGVPGAEGSAEHEGGEAPAVEKSEDELKEEEAEMYESRKERERDPINEGKKNWLSYRKLLKESAEKSAEEKLEIRIASIKKQIEEETDPEEKEELKKDLGKAKMQLARLNGGKKDSDEMKKHVGKED